MPSRRESFCRGRPPEIVIWVPKPLCACPVDCVRAVATPGSRAAKSEAERPLRGRSVTLLELTTPLTPDAPPSLAPGLLSVRITMSTRLSTQALIVTVVLYSTKPGAETVISKVPGDRFGRAKEPSSFAAIIFVSPFAGFLRVTRAFVMRALLVLVILPER